MTRSRTDRRELLKGRSYRTYGIAGVVVVVLASAALATALVAREPGVELPAEPTSTVASFESTHTAEDFSAEPTQTIEVPDLVGRTLKEAQLILSAAGLLTHVDGDEATVGDDEPVTAQEPAAGEMLASGAVVTVLVGDAGAPPSPAEALNAVPSERAMAPTGVVVCIDPGHQSRSNTAHEPVGPGADETKPKVTGGTTGVATRLPEYEVVLQISMNLKARLEAEGITVVMTRETNDVDISNSERAKIANEAGAALFVRIHADGSTDSSVVGVSTLYPASNRWTSGFAQDSARAASTIHESVVGRTGAVSRGTVARTDIAGFNWAQVPSVLVECGFMSNPVEDKLLASPHYQDKLADGMTRGILDYLGRQ